MLKVLDGYHAHYIDDPDAKVTECGIEITTAEHRISKTGDGREPCYFCLASMAGREFGQEHYGIPELSVFLEAAYEAMCQLFDGEDALPEFTDEEDDRLMGLFMGRALGESYRKRIARNWPAETITHKRVR